MMEADGSFSFFFGFEKCEQFSSLAAIFVPRGSECLFLNAHASL